MVINILHTKREDRK